MPTNKKESILVIGKGETADALAKELGAEQDVAGVRCPECDKFYSATLDSYMNEYIRARGMCRDCLEDTKGLVKVGNHYVPWAYRNNAEPQGDTPSPARHYEDANASLPSITMDERYGKWKLTFDSADFGGYDVTTLTWYFDNLADLIAMMKGEYDGTT